MAEYGYRYYSAEMGRWLGRDPLFEAGGANLYGFVSNGGVNRWDVLGLEESPWGSYDPASPKFDPTSYEVGDQFMNDACGRRWAFKARMKRWFRLSDNPQNRCCGSEWSIAGTEGNKIWAEAGRQHAEDESRRKHDATFGSPEDTIQDPTAALIAEAERRASNPLGLDPQNVAAVSKGLKQSAVTTAGVLANIAMAIDTGGVLGEISAVKSADHIILGLRANGLEQTAEQIGARHLLNDANWRTSLQTAIAKPSTKFTISVDGFSGSTTYSQIMGAAQRGMTPAARATEWEMSQLYQAGRLGDATLMQGGKIIPNPFAP